MQLSPQKAPPGGVGTASNAPATGPKVRTLAELIDAYQAAYARRSGPRELVPVFRAQPLAADAVLAKQL